jgi:hypothetical protein
MSIRKILSLLPLVAALSGCATPGDSSALNPRLAQAPLLHAQWWRTEFYGYDTVAYRLRQKEGTPGQSELLLEVHYGGSGPDDRALGWPGSEPQPLRVYEHAADRCQIFGSLQSRCVFGDILGVDLPPGLLEQSRDTGLTVVLLSKKGAEHSLPLPGEYIASYLASLKQAR